MWPFPDKDKPVSQRQLLNEEKDQHLINAALDPRPTIHSERKAIQRDQYAQILQWQEDRTQVLVDIFCGLAGLHVVKQADNTLAYQPDPNNKALCSMWAAKKLTEFIRPEDHNAMLANWDDKKINSEMLSTAVGIMDYITLNNDELKIDLKNFEYIVDMMVLAQHPTYQRGFNDGERRVVKETIDVKEVSTGRPEKVQQKVFGIPISS